MSSSKPMQNGSKKPRKAPAKKSSRSAQSQKTTKQPKQRKPQPHPQSRAAEKNVMRALSKSDYMRSPELRDAALATLLPERVSRGPVDFTKVGGASSLESTRLMSSFNVDMFALYTKLISTATRPKVNTPDGEGISLFPSGAVPVVHFHDPCCPLLMPAFSAAVPSVGVPRKWMATLSCNPVEKVAPVVAMTYNYSLVPRTSVTATGSDTTKFPSEFRVRPITRARNAEANVEYLWMDADDLTPTGVQFAIDFSLTSSVAITTGNVSVILKTIFLGADQEEQVNSVAPQTAVFVLNGASSKYEASVNIADLVSTSGWYRFAIDVSYPIINGTPLYTGLNVIARATFDEFLAIGTGFFVDPNFASLTALALRYWTSASSALVSFRSPPLTAGGSAYGTNLLTWKDWQQPCALGDALSRAQAPITESANGMQGYNLLDGIYVWEKQRVSPSSLLDSSVDLPFLPTSAVAERPPIAYLIGGSGAFDGGSILFFDPSASSTGATVVMRFETTTLIAYQPRNKIVCATNGPQFLLPDQLVALQHVLRDVPNFSANDWHDAFAKIAGVVHKIAQYVVNGVSAMAGNPIAAVSFAADAAADWKRFIGQGGRPQGRGRVEVVD